MNLPYWARNRRVPRRKRLVPQPGFRDGAARTKLVVLNVPSISGNDGNYGRRERQHQGSRHVARFSWSLQALSAGWCFSGDLVHATPGRGWPKSPEGSLPMFLTVPFQTGSTCRRSTETRPLWSSFPKRGWLGRSPGCCWVWSCPQANRCRKRR